MIPAELRALPQWVVAGRNKVPLNARTLHAASTTDPRTFATYDEALAVARQHSLYIGFVFTAEDPYCGVDLDAPDDDAQVARHQLIFENVVTYTELSVSGKGLHLIARATIPHAMKRDKVEVYDRERYFIFTGNVMQGRPTEILDCNDILNQMVAEMGVRSNRISISHSEPEKENDADVLNHCASIANGDKFKALWQGQWQGYSSQSEADYALINHLAFISPNNEQCKRMFRASALGQRDKALREDYLDTMLGQIRGEQHPPVDFSQFRPPPLEVTRPAFRPSEPEALSYPEGLVGEIAQYIYATATRPVPQVALGAALGLMAGMCGRVYNINHTGLNLYLLLVAATAIGKEGAKEGIDRIIQAVRPRIPAIQQYMGPGEYASGQALIKQLAETPGYLSVMSEFGQTLQKICSPGAIGSDVMWRKVFLELFTKSGANKSLGSMVYSDTGKNTPTINSPALTVLGETTYAALAEGIDEQAVEIGLIPRFLLIECGNYRPPSNPNYNAPPPSTLVDKIEALAHRCLSMEANNTHVDIELDPRAHALLGPRQAFDSEIDNYINAQTDEVTRQIWSRAHLKALRVAGVLAVGMGFDRPVVTEHAAQWAIDLARADAQHMVRRFTQGVGVGDPVQLATLRRIIVNTLKSKLPKKMKEYNIVPYSELSSRAYSISCFRKDRRGAGMALRAALQALMDGGEVIELSKKDSQEHFNSMARCFVLTNSFQYQEE